MASINDNKPLCELIKIRGNQKSKPHLRIYKGINVAENLIEADKWVYFIDGKKEIIINGK